MSPTLRGGVWNVATGRLLPYTGWALAGGTLLSKRPRHRDFTDRLGCDLQCGRVHHLRLLWAGMLLSGHHRKIDCLRLGDGSQNGPLRCNQGLFQPVLSSGGGRNQLCCRRLLCSRWWGRLKASATTFSWPDVCLMSDVNSAMKDSCLCWQADQGGVVRNRDVTSGLWSVSRRNCRPSSRNLKSLTALKAASSSLSKVEYLMPAPDSFLE